MVAGGFVVELLTKVIVHYLHLHLLLVVGRRQLCWGEERWDQSVHRFP